MKHLFFFLLFSVFVLSCKNNEQRGEITIGEYAFSFPNDFVLVEENGIDSYVGNIKGKSHWLGFDYGYYSDPLIETTKEYLEKGFWKKDAYSWFIEPKGNYISEMVREIQLLDTKPVETKEDSSKFKGADIIAVCKLDTTTFEYGITFPDEIKAHDIIVDTIKDHYRKVVVAKDPQKGITGIYLKNLNGFAESINAFSALSMATNGLTKHQQDSFVNVFRNVKVIKTR